MKNTITEPKNSIHGFNSSLHQYKIKSVYSHKAVEIIKSERQKGKKKE